MAHFMVFRCDACGEKMKGSERAEGAILLPDERMRAKENAPKSMIEAMMSGKRGYEPKEERFDLCLECALALLVAFKMRRKEATPEA